MGGYVRSWSAPCPFFNPSPAVTVALHLFCRPTSGGPSVIPMGQQPFNTPLSGAVLCHKRPSQQRMIAMHSGGMRNYPREPVLTTVSVPSLTLWSVEDKAGGGGDADISTHCPRNCWASSRSKRGEGRAWTQL